MKESIKSASLSTISAYSVSSPPQRRWTKRVRQISDVRPNRRPLKSQRASCRDQSWLAARLVRVKVTCLKASKPPTQSLSPTTVTKRKAPQKQRPTTIHGKFRQQRPRTIVTSNCRSARLRVTAIHWRHHSLQRPPGETRLGAAPRS